MHEFASVCRAWKSVRSKLKILLDVVFSYRGDSVEQVMTVAGDAVDSNGLHLAQPVSEREDSHWPVEMAMDEEEEEEATPTNVEELPDDGCYLEPLGGVACWLNSGWAFKITSYANQII